MRVGLPQPRMKNSTGLLILLFSLLLFPGCPNQESYVPPDLVYLFASYPVGKNPTSIRTGDFNQDGFTDLITSNIRSNTLSILFGNGDGSFRDHVSMRACQEPRNLVVDDYNQDGRQDLAVACSGSDQVNILLGEGNGDFKKTALYSVHRSPVSLASGDYNMDQQLDLAVALRNDKVRLLFGIGNGKFRMGPLYEHGDTPTSIATADLNRDGHLDLAVTNGGPMSNAVSIWLGQGDGTFLAPTDYHTGKRPLSVSFADFNNDGVLDLLVINGQMNTITIFLGNGDGSFEDGKDSGADAGPEHGVAQDFNGDKILDVAILNIQSGSLSLLYGRGDGTFRYPPRHYQTPRGPFAITTLQVATDREEEPGLAIANNASHSVSIFLHHGLKSRATSES